MSNTVVQLALFETNREHAPRDGCPRNLVYGELEGISLAKMLLAGIVLNLVAALAIAFWAFYIVPAL